MAFRSKTEGEPPQAKGHAAVLAIGTANPANCYYQQDYPDFLFRVTKTEHMTELKDKFKRICEKSTIKKRYLHITEEILEANPNIAIYKAPSLDARQDICLSEVPKLGKEAALKAIKEWGQPISKITHLVFYTSSCVDSPGADFQLIKLLGLNPSVCRTMIYHQGCYAGGTALRHAKELAENNAHTHARVLVVCCEITTMFFHAPSESRMDILVGQAVFGDGASAVIVGDTSNINRNHERPLYEIWSATQTIIPNSEHGVVLQFREMGFNYFLSPQIPQLVGSSIKDHLIEGFEAVNHGININDHDLNSLFYILHPGGPAILDHVEKQLGLEVERFRATRNVLRDYGNMGAPSVLFILDEMRNKSIREGKATTGEGFEWGALFGMGPGLTVETLVLRSVPTHGAAAAIKPS